MWTSGLQESGGRGLHAPSWVSRVIEEAASALGRFAADLTRPARNRRVLHRLAGLSDRELKDIGLWRQDVRDADLYRDGDVSAFLIARRSARRSAWTARRR